MKTIVLAALLFTTPALAHDQWANGKAVPDWVKSSCCGPADAHRLEPDQIHHSDLGFYTVSGVVDFSDAQRIEDSLVLPSQDGHYWLFFSGGYNNNNTVYCFFVPMDF